MEGRYVHHPDHHHDQGVDNNSDGNASKDDGGDEEAGDEFFIEMKSNVCRQSYNKSADGNSSEPTDILSSDSEDDSTTFPSGTQRFRFVSIS